MTSRLTLYNDALLMCGERFLSTLSDNVEHRYLLDHVWDNQGVHHCLESGQWKFAMRTILLDYDTSVTPAFGYTRAFLKPTDWCLTSAMCTDEYFNSPNLRYVEEAGYWYCDLDEIYVRYVSDASNFGGDLSRWTSRFARYVAAYFASRIILKLTSDQNKHNMFMHPSQGLVAKYLMEAKNIDAMAEPTKFLPQGSWNDARGGRRDREGRWSNSNLTG